MGTVESLQICVVDSSATDHSSLLQQLESAGVGINAHFKNPDDAKRSVLAHDGPSLILFYLPESVTTHLNYVRFFQRGARHGTQVLFIASAALSERIVNAYLELGACGFLNEPDPQEILRTVEGIVAQPHQFQLADQTSDSASGSSSELFHKSGVFKAVPTDHAAPDLPTRRGPQGAPNRSSDPSLNSSNPKLARSPKPPVFRVGAGAMAEVQEADQATFRQQQQPSNNVMAFAGMAIILIGLGALAFSMMGSWDGGVAATPLPESQTTKTTDTGDADSATAFDYPALEKPRHEQPEAKEVTKWPTESANKSYQRRTIDRRITSIKLARIAFAEGQLGSTDEVVLEGMVTLGEGGFVPRRRQCVIQLDGAGIVIDDPNLKGRYFAKRGEYIRVTGYLDEYKALTQLRLTQPTRKLPTRGDWEKQLAPRPITIAEIIEEGERYEGLLLTFTGLTRNHQRKSSDTKLFFYQNEQGQILQIRFHAQSIIPLPPPNDIWQITGILYQRKDDETGKAPYILHPRDVEDVIAR